MTDQQRELLRICDFILNEAGAFEVLLSESKAIAAALRPFLTPPGEERCHKCKHPVGPIGMPKDILKDHKLVWSCPCDCHKATPPSDLTAVAERVIELDVLAPPGAWRVDGTKALGAYGVWTDYPTHPGHDKAGYPSQMCSFDVQGMPREIRDSIADFIAECRDAAPALARAYLSRQGGADDLASLRATFDLRWEADMRAIERWRGKNPKRELIQPDHADLCVWLMEENDRLRERLGIPTKEGA